MEIICPYCETSYRIAPESLGDSGRSVRCTSCHNVWFVGSSPETPDTDEAAAPSIIGPRLDDVVEIGLSAASRPARDAASSEQTFAAEGATTLDSGLRDVGHPSDWSMQAAPSIVPPDDPDHGVRTGLDVETAAARRIRLKKERRKLTLRDLKPSLPVTIGLLMAALTVLVVERQRVVRHLPQTASLYAAIGLPVNLRGLVFNDIKTFRESGDGQHALVVEGNIAGITRKMTEVPRLRFGVIDRTGKEIYAWTARPERQLLPPGETLSFRSRLASPPEDADRITVRFYNKHDIQTGLM